MTSEPDPSLRSATRRSISSFAERTIVSENDEKYG